MCGIAGYIGKTKFKPTEQQLKNCLASLQRRGPDSKGINIIRNGDHILQFIHTRLSIVDLSKSSNQPFEDEDGIIIFNGMIYNFLELKNDLKKRGVFFRTNSDTEVLLKMLNIYGKNSFKYLDGMWSFAYFNKKKSKILISRDRFGEKPLYYLCSNKNVFFSNSIKAISTLYSKKLKLNEKKIEQYLKYPDKSVGIDTNSLFSSIEVVEPSSFIEIDFNNLKIIKKKYWDLEIKNSNVSYKKAINLIKDITKDVIKTRIRSDVKSCILLSGGLDSNTIAAGIKNQKKIKAYSLVSSNKKYDESKLIKLSAKKNKIGLNLIPSKNSNAFNILNDIIKNSYSLIPATTALGFAILCEKIKKDKNKIILTGAGGDELFAGYYVNFMSQILSFKGKKRKLKIKFWERNIKKFIRNPLLRDIQSNKLKKNINSLNSYIEGDKILKKYFLNKKKYKVKKFSKDPFYNNMFQNLFCQSIPAQNLQYDLVAMNYSLEPRAPFLSHKMAELVYSFKKDYFMYKGKTKSLLRDSIKNTVHKKIVNNFEKTGFYSPFSSFFSIKDHKKILSSILKSKIIFKFIFKKKLLNLLAKKSTDVSHTESKLLFACLNVALLEKIIYR